MVGSGNAGVVGALLFSDCPDVRIADESTYSSLLDGCTEAVLVSASGGKDAVRIAKELQKRRMPTWLLTTNPAAPANAYVDPSHRRLFPKNREPYTYNTSTYLGMVLAKTGERVEEIQQCITDSIALAVPDTLGQYDAFFFLIPSEYALARDMLLTKFDELFGSKVSARVFTVMQARHAKTVVPSDTECFISLGVENETFGNASSRLFIPLPEHAGYAALIAIGYYIIGQIQRQHPPYFQEHIVRYATDASVLFGSPISPIVD